MHPYTAQINQLRAAGYSDTSIARALGIDSTTVWRWRLGNPISKKRWSIAEKLKFDTILDELIGDSSLPTDQNFTSRAKTRVG